MASTQKTSKGFNKWVANDKPTRSDFNSDNEKATALLEELDGKLQLVDTKLAELDAQLENKANKGMVYNFLLEFLTGYDGHLQVAVTQENVVHLVGEIKATGGFARGAVFAKLPAGLRPLVHIPVIVWASGYVGGHLRIASSGDLYFANVTNSSQTNYYINCTFIAEQ